MKKNERDQNESQIIKISGGGKFLEVLNSMFSRQHVLLSFQTYDESKAVGSRITAKINIFIDFGTFFVLAADTMSGRYQKMLIKEPDCVAFESMGGSSPESLRKQNRARQDTNCEFRKFQIVRASKSGYAFLLTAESGPGKRSKTNGYVPIEGYRAEQKICIPLTAVDMKKLVLTVEKNIDAYLSGKYSVMLFQQKKEERTQKRSEEDQCPTEERYEDPYMNSADQ